MSEVNPWWGRLGVEPPEEGAKAQEVTDPADVDVGAEGGNGQEVTDPAALAEKNTNGAQGAAEAPAQDGTGTKDVEDAVPYKEESAAPTGQTETSEPTDGVEGTEGKTAQTAEERRAQAQRRRQREREELQQQLRAENADAMKTVFASLGLKTGDGKNVETMEDFEIYQTEQRSRRVQRDLKNGNLTPEALRQAVLDAPEVKQVLQNAQNATAEAQRVQQEAMEAKFSANMQRELAEIRKLNPAIKTTDDIIRMETGPEYARLLRSGLRPSEAYKLANFDSIRDRERSAAEQAARNASASKSHLQGLPNAGKAPLAPPKEYAQQLRRFIPNITEQEIAKYYAKHQKD